LIKPFFQHWNSIERSLKKKPIVLFLDFDGTLSPIVPKVEDAYLPRVNQVELKRLSKKLRGRVAIVSGRALKDLKKKVGFKNFIYVGNHGLEIGGPHVRFKAAGAASARKVMAQIKKKLCHELGSVHGIFLEDKDLTMSLHYRMVKGKDIPLVQRTFKKIVRPYVSKRQVKINPGKKVFEIKPPVNWHKGRAVRWLLSYWRRRAGKSFFPVYIGDDITDEDAFAAVGRNGLGVVVGHTRPSKATFFVRDQKQVTTLLKKLASLN